MDIMSPKTFLAASDDYIDLLDACYYKEEERKLSGSTFCFRAWGRGRPRLQLSEIILPKEESISNQTTLKIFHQKKPVSGRGRGKLLEIDSDEDAQQTQVQTIRPNEELSSNFMPSAKNYLMERKPTERLWEKLPEVDSKESVESTESNIILSKHEFSSNFPPLTKIKNPHWEKQTKRGRGRSLDNSSRADPPRKCIKK